MSSFGLGEARVGSRPVEIAVGVYDRTLPLLLGDVRIADLHYRLEGLPPSEIFWRALRNSEFDVMEISAANLAIRVGNGDRSLLGLPIFLVKGFPHLLMFVSEGSEIANPRDLEGKRIGIPAHSMTASVWQKGILRHYFDVDLETVTWFVGGKEGHKRQGRVQVARPPSRSESVPESVSLLDLAREGSVDALFLFFNPMFREQGAGLRCIWPDLGSSARDFHQRSGIAPVIHLLAVRDSSFQGRARACQSLMETFSTARTVAFERLTGGELAALSGFPDPFTPMSVALRDYGRSFWSDGIPQNAKTLEKLVQFVHDQGLTRNEIAKEDLFAPESLEWNP